MQRIGFQSVTGIFLCHTRERPGPRDVNRQRNHKHKDRGHAGLDVHAAEEQSREGLVNNVEGGERQQSGFDEGREILELPMTVEMTFIGGLIRHPDREKSDNCCNQVQRGVQRFGKDAEASRSED